MNIYLLKTSGLEKIVVKCRECESHLSGEIRGKIFYFEEELKKEGKYIKCPCCNKLLGYDTDLKKLVKNNIQRVFLISNDDLESLQRNQWGTGSGWG